MPQKFGQRSHLNGDLVAVLSIPFRNPLRDIRIRGCIVRAQAGDHDRNEGIRIGLLLEIP